MDFTINDFSIGLFIWQLIQIVLLAGFICLIILLVRYLKRKTKIA